MKIADSDRLIKHFENVVDVKLFTVPQIVTIIENFSVEIPEGTELIMPGKKAQDMILDNLKLLFEKQKPGIDNKLLSEEQTDVPRLPLQLLPEFGGKGKPFIGGKS